MSVGGDRDGYVQQNHWTGDAATASTKLRLLWASSLGFWRLPFTDMQPGRETLWGTLRKVNMTLRNDIKKHNTFCLRIKINYKIHTNIGLHPIAITHVWQKITFTNLHLYFLINVLASLSFLRRDWRIYAFIFNCIIFAAFRWGFNVFVTRNDGSRACAL